MPGYYWFFIFLLIILMISRRKKRRRAAASVILRRRKKGKKIMDEMIKQFIGKDVLIYTINDSSALIEGGVEAVNDGWVTLKGFESGETQLVNVEYITRVREYPKDKNGKRKVIWS